MVKGNWYPLVMIVSFGLGMVIFAPSKEQEKEVVDFQPLLNSVFEEVPKAVVEETPIEELISHKKLSRADIRRAQNRIAIELKVLTRENNHYASSKQLTEISIRLNELEKELMGYAKRLRELKREED